MDLWHIISPEAMSRISASMWKDFLVFMKQNYSHRLNWEVYPSIPVYEYQASPDDLEHSIRYYLSNKLQGEIIVERFNFDNSFVPGYIPASHQQHLSL
jgi:hypothetical protein